MEYREVYQKAIDTYGVDEQMRIIYEEMCELGVALSKYHREPGAETLSDVCEEIADVQIMIAQAKLMFGESEVQKLIDEKTERLKSRIEENEEVEVVHAKHQYLSTDTYKWVNPDNIDLEVGDIVFAETKYGEKPVIVTKKSKVAKTFEGNYKKILRNANSATDTNVGTNPKFRIEDYQGKYVMHCDTEEKAKVFCKFLHSKGMCWYSDNSYLDYQFWKTEKENMCYEFNADFYGSINFYKSEGYKILEFDDFDWSDMNE